MSKKTIAFKTFSLDDAGSVEITAECSITGKLHIITVDKKDYDRWQNGEMIQDVFPNMSTENREILISGMTDAEWHDMFND